MRHDSLKDPDSFDRVSVPAVWPRATQVMPLPVADAVDEVAEQVTSATPAVPDVPPAAGIMIAGTYVALLAALALVTAGSGKSIFAIVIAAFFVFMFFSVPAIFFGVDGANRAPRSFNRFMQEGMQTLTGHCSGKAVLIQMLMVPVLLTFGVICMGIAAAFIF